MVVACCRFLCYFCRTSRQNQKAMFDHFSFLLENSNILLSRPSLRGSTPLDVAYSSLMENTELALALRYLRMDSLFHRKYKYLFIKYKYFKLLYCTILSQNI
jgi:hypothetical protein